MTQGYRVDVEAYDAYVAVVPGFTYGLVAAGNIGGEAISPLTVDNGKVATANDKVILANFALNVNNFVDIKVIGLTDATVDKTIIFCAYVFDGTSVKYIENGAIVDTVVGNTYNNIVAQSQQ